MDMVGQVMMPNIYGAVTGGMEDGRVRAAKNALAQAVQQGGPTSPGAMNALSALDPGRAAAMSQQAQQFDASQAQSADQFGQGMDLRSRQFDYGVERDNIGDRRAAASAGAAAGRQRDAASSAAAADKAKKGAALISQIMQVPEANRAAAWQRGLQIASSMGLSVEGLPPEYPGDDAAGMIYSQLSGSAMERAAGPEWRATTGDEAGTYGRPGQMNINTGQYKPGPSPGQEINVGADGSIRIGQGGAGPEFGRTTSNAIDAQVFDGANMLARLDSIASSFKPEYQDLGNQVSLWVDGMADKLGGLAPEDAQGLAEYSKFRARSIANVNATIKEITGAAMSAAEGVRIRQQLPDPGDRPGTGDGPTVFKAKLDDSIMLTKLSIARAHMMKSRGMNVLTADGNLASGVPQLDDMVDVIRSRERSLVADLRASGVKDAEIPALVEAGLKQEFGL